MYILKDDSLYQSALIASSMYCSLDQNQDYAYGYCLKQTAKSSAASLDFMRFPKANLAATACNYDMPVKYLVNQDRSTCPIIVDLNLNFCDNSNNSIINYERYSLQDMIKTSVSIEYWKCDSPFTGSRPVAVPAQLNLSCNLNASDLTSICFLNSQTKLFDFNYKCQSSEWSYSAANIQTIPLDYYAALNSGCTLMVSSPQKPIASG